MTSPPSLTAFPATLCPPPRTESNSSCSRATLTQATTSAVPEQRAITCRVAIDQAVADGPRLVIAGITGYQEEFLVVDSRNAAITASSMRVPSAASGVCAAMILPFEDLTDLASGWKKKVERRRGRWHPGRGQPQPSSRIRRPPRSRIDCLSPTAAPRPARRRSLRRHSIPDRLRAGLAAPGTGDAAPDRRRCGGSSPRYRTRPA